MKDLESHTKLEAFIKQMYDWQIDVSVLSEPCIEWRDVIPRTNVQEEIRKKFDKTSNWTVATSTCFSGSFVEPGEALVYSTGGVVSRIMERGTDPWGYGRLAHVKYRGKDGKIEPTYLEQAHHGINRKFCWQRKTEY